MRWGVGTITLWPIVAVVLVVLAAGETKSDPTNESSQAVSVVRLFSAAEIDYFHTNSRYAGFAELVNSKQLAQTAMESPEHLSAYRSVNLQSDSEPVAGYVLGLIVAADGTTYKLSLTQKTVKCGFGVFTDEKGLLYEGKAIDCTTADTASGPLPTWAEPDATKAIPAVRTDAPCPLPQLLQGASSRVQELSDNLQQFSAKERIDHVEVGKNGKPHTTTSVFDYVAAIHQEESGHAYVEEYRSGPSGVETSPATLADTGTAAFALIFHPRHIEEFAMDCDGSTTVGGRPVWQVHFAQRPDRINDFHAFRVNKMTYRVKLKGLAWIAADNYEVVRLETDLMEPIKQINLQTEHMIIDYAPVDFPKHKVKLWLPESSALYVDYRGHRYERRHNFSDFQLFWVEAEQKVKEPHPGQGFAPQKD